MKPILFIEIFLLLLSPCLPAQTPCDTAKMITDLAMLGTLLDEGQIQSAVDGTFPLLKNLEDCPEADSTFREQVMEQVGEYYQTASVEFMYRGLINQSIDMSDRCLALYRQIPGNHTEQIANTCLDLCNGHSLNDNRKLAVEHAVEGLKIRQAANPNNPKITAHYDRIITNCIAMGDTENALLYLREWQMFCRKLGVKTPIPARVGLATNWAAYYYELGAVDQGIRILEDTLAQYGELLRAKGVMASGLVGIAEFNLCEYYSITGNFEKALYYAEKNVSLFEQRLQQQSGKLLGRSHYAWCLAQAAKAAWGLYRQTQDTSWYNFAEKRSRQAEDMIFAMRDRAPNDGFMDWMGDDIDIVANIAEVRQGMFAKTGNRQHAERAFEAVEASKTFAIQAFLHETYALHWGGLPDSLYALETTFRTQINHLETYFFMVRTKPDADSLIEANDQKLFALRNQYNVLLQYLEYHYPEYYRLKYSHPAVNLRQVQQQLHPGQCLLDLYIRNGLVLAMLVRPDTIVWLATPYDTLEHQVMTRLKAESQVFNTYQSLPEKEYLQRLQAYADASHHAYQFLIAPLRQMLSEEVLLIPRNDLATFPFGALLTQQETNMGKPFQWHFLDNELVISQAFSVGLFQFVTNRSKAKKPSGSVLALAPFFEGRAAPDFQLPVGDVTTATRRDFFNPLPYSGAEAKAISQLMSGQALMGVDANKANFLQKGHDFNILHFATHSAANDVLGEYSFVALQAAEHPTKKIDMLYARDIYSLQLSADLVVLSACETALGQYRYGEGVIGLTRAFTCAGAQNVVASLWSVNDASTKNLMVLFYQEIKKGIPYNRALTNAKRAFVQQNRQYALPYYWAGFVLNGQ